MYTPGQVVMVFQSFYIIGPSQWGCGLMGTSIHGHWHSSTLAPHPLARCSDSERLHSAPSQIKRREKSILLSGEKTQYGAEKVTFVSISATKKAHIWAVKWQSGRSTEEVTRPAPLPESATALKLFAAPETQLTSPGLASLFISIYLFDFLKFALLGLKKKNHLEHQRVTIN